jgi:glycogen debranching enzyme
MKQIVILIATSALLLTRCSSPDQNTELITKVFTDSIEGKPQYLQSPFVTAGDRVYIVGYQDGTFPDLGWHITGEMGGVWDHPIKLMDGFSAFINIKEDSNSICLDHADKFVNFPFANKHHFLLKDQEIDIERTQFIPDNTEGAVIQFKLTNRGTSDKDIEFSFVGMTDLRPTWLGDRTGMNDGEDDIVFDKELNAAIAKDQNNPWYVAFGSSMEPDGFTNEKAACVTTRSGKGKNAQMKFSLSLDADQTIIVPIFIAGSYQSEDAVRKNYNDLKSNAHQKLLAKADRFKQLISTSKLTLEDKGVQKMYEWLKYNTDWLVRNVPEQGTGLSAGLPDYPWWFGCDNTYALQGVLATGNHELVKNTILLLNKISKQTNTNGRIIHEVSTNGSVYNPGNVNETAQFITLVWNYYAWTGDKDFIKEIYPDIQKGINWLQKEKDPDGNGYPNGSGMMEIPGLDTEMIDVVAYTQQAYSSAANLAMAVDDQSSALEYQKLSDQLRTKINSEWWQADEKSYGDFRGTVSEAKPVVGAAIIRADTLGKPWAVKDLKAMQAQLKKYPSNRQIPHVVYHNWVVNTPLETGAADPEKAKLALQTVHKYQNPFGIFVTGIDRTEDADSVVLKARKKIFSYTGAVMTLPTGVAAVSSAKYGNADDAWQYIKKLENSFSYALPGSMYEVSPDFGMVTQAWNIYGVAVPIVEYFFGIQPMAAEKTISLTPLFPSSWNEASIEDVIVGQNHINIAYKVMNDHREINLTQSENGWKITLNLEKAKKVIVNGTEQSVGKAIELKDQNLSIEIY